jgi:uncharacterized protein (TIGR02001 family)
MRLSIVTASLLSALVALPALAADEPAPSHTFTGNMSLASEYIYRGIAQTNRKPAIQGGMDYSHSSGLYAGTWASNISWLSDAASSAGAVSAPIEIDTYGGYKHSFGDINIDVGALKYWYPGTYPAGTVNPDTLEVYLGAGWQFVSFKYSYALTNLFGAVSTQKDGSSKKTDGSAYYDLSANPDLGGGFTLNLHAGRQQVANFPGASYNDYKAGVTYELAGWALSAAYITTTAKASAGDFYRSGTQNRDLGSNRFVVAVGKTF